MARLKDLGSLRKQELKEIVLDTLPEKIQMTDYALEKGYKTNELVRKVHKKSYEWYGFLLGPKSFPEIVTDIHLGESEANETDYVSISAENIQRAMSSLPQDTMINGWIHSHGDMGYHRFSGTDYRNMSNVLKFVSPVTRKAISKKELSIKELSLLVEGHEEEALKKGIVTAVTDREIGKLKLFETVYGSFSYSVVIDDSRWHEQCISYEKQGILSPISDRTNEPCLLDIISSEKKITGEDIMELENDVRTKIKPVDPKAKYEKIMSYLKSIGIDLSLLRGK